MYDESGVYFSKTRSKSYGKGNENWPVTQKYLDTLKKGMKVLDVGCGNGRLVSGLPKGGGYVGFDFSNTLLNEAKKKYPKQEFFLGDVVDSKTWNKLGKYDAIFCVAVIHHLPEREQQLYALKQMKKHAKKQALMFLSVWNLWQDRFLQAHLDSLNLKKHNERWTEVPFDKKWKRFVVQMDIPYLVELAKEAGWEVEEVYFADKYGERAHMQNGQNLVIVAR